MAAVELASCKALASTQEEGSTGFLFGKASKRTQESWNPDKAILLSLHFTWLLLGYLRVRIAVLRPLQSTASVTVASASAASLGFVRHLQRCGQCGLWQVGGDGPAGVAAAVGVVRHK